MPPRRLTEVERIEQDVELSGVARDTPLFVIRVRQGKVELCQTKQHVADCDACRQYENCSMVREHRTAMQYELPNLLKSQKKDETQRERNNPWLHL